MSKFIRSLRCLADEWISLFAIPRSVPKSTVRSNSPVRLTKETISNFHTHSRTVFESRSCPTDGGGFYFCRLALCVSADRRFHYLDLVQRKPEEVEEYLNRYLSRERVCSDDAFRDAIEDCEAASRRRQIEDAIPRAWQALLSDCDEYVSFQLNERVRDLTGVSPSADSIEEFLRSRALKSSLRARCPRLLSKTPAGTGAECQRASTECESGRHDGGHERRWAMVLD